MDVVDAADARPELGGARVTVGEGGLLPRIRAIPGVGADDLRGVGRVLERVVGTITRAFGDGLHLGVDRDHRVAETVQLGLGLTLGGLDHERAGNGERHGGRMVAVVHQALRGVLDLEPVFLPTAQVDDALMGDEPALAAVEHGEAALEALRDVVGVEDGASGGLGGYAVQYILNGGGTPVGVVSSPEKVGLLNDLGVEHVIDRRASNYKFWADEHTQDETEWRRLGKDIRSMIGRDVDIVFEHPGEATFPVSSLVCKKGGMVVICAGTSGFNCTFDVRYMWMHQKRLHTGS